MVDVACGRGRHTLAGARDGLPIHGIDRNRAWLAQLRDEARAAGLHVGTACVDLEAGHPLPLRDASCGALLVFRYLHRPLAPDLERVLRPGGILLYETFTIHQRKLGYGPSRDAFLLSPGELPALFPGLHVEDSWEGLSEAPRPAWVARLMARRLA